MDWFGHFFDPGNNGFDLDDVGRILAVLSPVVIASVFILRWYRKKRIMRQRAMEQRIQAAIVEATRPIQPGANGGASLPDLHKKVDDFANYQKQVNDLLIARQATIADQLYAHTHDKNPHKEN